LAASTLVISGYFTLLTPDNWSNQQCHYQQQQQQQQQCIAPASLTISPAPHSSKHVRDHARSPHCIVYNLQVAQLKAWVTDSSLEDEEFFKLSQNSKTKKTDWVKFVKKKLAAC
jgi:hypothetical protein